MLFAVEGGGFFSSSASGYSKGLTLLLLGQKNEEKPMRVTPWNQYPLAVEQEAVRDLQLASNEDRFVCGCTSFVCCGHTATAHSPSPLKVGSAQNQELAEASVVVEIRDKGNLAGNVDEDNRDRKVFSLKSSLRKEPDNPPAPVVAMSGGCINSSERESLCGENDCVACPVGRRKVQWTDKIGGELFEVREFEMSDADDELKNGNERTCSCTIM